MARDFFRPQANGKIAVYNIVFQKIVLDDFSLIAQAQDEIFKPIIGIQPHNISEHWLIPNHDHRLRPELSFFP
ncbi:MAG: hypothetical protein ACE5KG_05555, partial [Nitrososphaerales archaeon]